MLMAVGARLMTTRGLPPIIKDQKLAGEGGRLDTQHYYSCTEGGQPKIILRRGGSFMYKKEPKVHFLFFWPARTKSQSPPEAE